MRVARTLQQAFYELQSSEIDVVVSEVDLDQPEGGITLRAAAKDQPWGRELVWVVLARRSDRELESVREATVPIASVSGAVVRSPWWRLGRAERLVLTAADLRAFEGLTGPGGLELAHPAQLVFEVRKVDKDAARELATQVELAIGDHALRIAEGDAAAAPALVGAQAEKKLLGPGDG